MSRRVPQRRTPSGVMGMAAAYGRRGALLGDSAGVVAIDRHAGNVVGLSLTDSSTGVRVELYTDLAGWRKLRDALDDEARTWASATLDRAAR